MPAAALDQRARFQGVDDANHGRALEPDFLCEAALREPGVRLDEQQDADAAGRKLGHVSREVAEHRLLGEPQPVAEQMRQDAVAQRLARTLGGS